MSLRMQILAGCLASLLAFLPRVACQTMVIFEYCECTVDGSVSRVAEPGSLSFAACTQACVNDPTCVAVDLIDKSGSLYTCRKYTGTGTLSNTNCAAGTDMCVQYYPSTTTTTDTSITSTATTSTSHTTATATATASTTTSSTATTQSTSTSTGTTASATVSTTTTSCPAGTLVNQSIGCCTSDAISHGITTSPTSMTHDHCWAACEGDAECVAVDMKLPNADSLYLCTLYLGSGFAITGSDGDTACSCYKKDCAPPGSTTTTTSDTMTTSITLTTTCLPGSLGSIGMGCCSASGFIETSGNSITLLDCATECSNNASCMAIDMPSAAQCRLFIGSWPSIDLTSIITAVTCASATGSDSLCMVRACEIPTTTMTMTTTTTWCHLGQLEFFGNGTCDFIGSSVIDSWQASSALCLHSCEVDDLCLAVDMKNLSGGSYNCTLYSYGGVDDGFQTLNATSDSVCYKKPLCPTTLTTTTSTTTTVECALSDAKYVGNGSCNCDGDVPKAFGMLLLSHCAEICTMDPTCVAAEMADPSIDSTSGRTIYRCSFYSGDWKSLCGQNTSAMNNSNMRCYQKECSYATITATSTTVTTTCPIKVLQLYGEDCCNYEATTVSGSVTLGYPSSLNETACLAQCENQTDCVGAELKSSTADCVGADCVYLCQLYSGNGTSFLGTTSCGSTGTTGLCYEKACLVTTTTTTSMTSSTSTSTPCPIELEELNYVGPGCCQSNGMSEQEPQALDMADCMMQCINDPTCKATDIRISPEGSSECRVFNGSGEIIGTSCNPATDQCFEKQCTGITLTETVTSTITVTTTCLRGALQLDQSAQGCCRPGNVNTVAIWAPEETCQARCNADPTCYAAALKLSAAGTYLCTLFMEPEASESCLPVDGEECYRKYCASETFTTTCPPKPLTMLGRGCCKGDAITQVHYGQEHYDECARKCQDTADCMAFDHFSDGFDTPMECNLYNGSSESLSLGCEDFAKSTVCYRRKPCGPEATTTFTTTQTTSTTSTRGLGSSDTESSAHRACAGFWMAFLTWILMSALDAVVLDR